MTILEIDCKTGEVVTRDLTAQEIADIAQVANTQQTLKQVQYVTPRQIRMALARAGLRTLVESAVAAGSQDLQDWYEFSTTFQRDQPLVVQMGIDMGQSPAQLDALWQLAATL